ncbi:MAG: hypothetical protein AB7G06_00365 [Bdellovibrionales bacterium]
MRKLRRLIGCLGIAFLVMGFYALINALLAVANGYPFDLASVQQLLTDAGDGELPLGEVAHWPAFFTFTIPGIVLTWWGLKMLPPKPKFRRG